MTALPLVLAAPAWAAQPQEPATAPTIAAEPAEVVVDFSADSLEYDSEAEIVTATGDVRMRREGHYLAADRVVWTRSTDQVVAQGNVVILSPAGDRLVSDRVVLTDELRSGTMDNLLVALEGGGRMAAERGSRANGITTLANAVYSPCPVTTPEGCPRKPSWRVTAVRVTHDPQRERVRFYGGRLELFGVTLPLLPVFSFSSSNRPSSGFLTPGLSLDNNNGVELTLPYYWRMAPNRDLTLTPHLYTKVMPAMEARFRQLSSLGALQLRAFGTYGRRTEATGGDRQRGLRGYFEGTGRFQLDPLWTLSGYTRLASDKTVLRRYDISRDDRLRSLINLERIDVDSYVSLAGWGFQGLRTDDRQKTFPIALPALDARLRLQPPALGGTIELQANSLAIQRIDGQDTQRAFASARWDIRRLTGMGQELLFTAFARGDVYHSDESGETATAIYRGTDGWNHRAISALAADVRWPLIGPLLGGLQRLTPRVQLVLTPGTNNMDIPNEDARSVDLEDSNLFALNRFPGYDRWEDSSRVTYGVEWAFDRPRLAIRTVVGQSYRLKHRPSIFPEGTGLTARMSDIVGRTRIQLGRLIDFTQRFRLDKDNLAVRRNELDLTYGTEETYVRAGYLRLNRNISPAIEDLRDREELRLAGRWKFARYWSLFGATVLDLTGRQEDPVTTSDGFEPVRHRLGIAYEDECLEIGLSWRRDYERIGELRQGNKLQLSFSLKGLGR